MAISAAVNPATTKIKDDLAELAKWRADYLQGDEKGEAQTFLARLFQAYGHIGVFESGASFETRIRKDPESKGVSFADLVWQPRVIFEMKKSSANLAKHFRQAADYWMQITPKPKYVVLCNFDEFWVYDFNIQAFEPVDKVKLSELSTRWEVLAFLLPQKIEPVFGNDTVAVTRSAAANVAKVFRSMTDRGVLPTTAQRFVLQCVMAMFSEDIGLLPTHMFTKAVKEAGDGTEAYDLIGGLFREMNTPGITGGGRFAGCPYFNGGLFSNVLPQELDDEEVLLLREACKQDWSTVRPEIFGTIFEQSMDKGERHASGAHFTSEIDIMRIVGPCIVSPWREKVVRAKTINDLEKLLVELAQYKVLDPACGSGNFLYVAYRELRRIEADINDRIHERRRGGLGKLATLSVVQPENFYGMDNNPFAVEVAKVTMMLAKKLSSDELHDEANVLPLDNLDNNILANDALFDPWPKASVIIGNPPYIGNRRMINELGAEYVDRVHRKFGPKGVADFVTYWFPIAHEHLPEGGRAGFVATNSIRQGDGRKASLDYVVDHGGTIIEAVSSIPWSGDAVVHVSLVSWQKAGELPPTRVLWLEEGSVREEVSEISSALSPRTDLRKARKLPCNRNLVTQGQTHGAKEAFVVDGVVARAIVRKEPSAREVVRPAIGGQELLHETSVDDYTIDIPDTDSGAAWAKYPHVMSLLEKSALPDRRRKADDEADKNAKKLGANPRAKLTWPRRTQLDAWWTLWRRRADLVASISRMDRYIALTRTTSFARGPVFTFVDGAFLPTDSTVAFPFDDDYTLGILQSSVHVLWYRERATTLKADPNFTSTTVSDTFPWPQHPDPEAVSRVARATAAIVEHRARSFAMGQSLAKQYDVLRRPGKSTLRDLHVELDNAVMAAYRFEPRSDVLAQLLALNLAVAAKEDAGEEVTGPGPVNGVHTRFSDWRFPAPTL